MVRANNYRIIFSLNLILKLIVICHYPLKKESSDCIKRISKAV